MDKKLKSNLLERCSASNIIVCDPNGEIDKNIGYISLAFRVLPVYLENIDMTESDAAIEHDIVELIKPRMNFQKNCMVVVTCLPQTLAEKGEQALQDLYHRTIRAVMNDFLDNGCPVPNFITMNGTLPLPERVTETVEYQFTGISTVCSYCNSNRPTQAQDHKLNPTEVRYCYYCGRKINLSNN